MVFKAAKAKAINTDSLSSLGASVVDLAKYVEDEFAQVAQTLQGDDAATINYKAPSKPRTGQLVYADGTHWNPGSGAGFYQYSGSAWLPTSNEALIPSGTVMLFWQAAAPTGWTQVTTQNDKALRVVSGTGGVSGGTNAFSTVMAQTVVGGHALALAEIPAHAHAGSSASAAYSSLGSGRIYTPDINNGTVVPGGGSSTWGAIDNSLAVSLSIASEGSGGAHNHSITMSIQYIDVILASKN